MSSLLEKILTPCIDLDSFPKSIVEIYIYVLELDGGMLLILFVK